MNLKKDLHFGVYNKRTKKWLGSIDEPTAKQALVKLMITVKRTPELSDFEVRRMKRPPKPI